MDKNTLIILLNDCFNEKKCAFLHLNNDSELLVTDKPEYFSLHMGINVEYSLGESNINEVYNIPYSIVSYVRIISVDDLNSISEYERNQNRKLYDDGSLR